MHDTMLAHWEMLVGRWYGPLSLRLILQPSIAAFLGVRAGLADSRTGRAAYGWSVVVGKERRVRLLREGWADIGKLFLTSLFIDFIYQLIVFRWLLPGQGLLVAATLAIPTYVAMRGLTSRVVHLAPSEDRVQSEDGPR
jgi:hypothetical protein